MSNESGVNRLLEGLVPRGGGQEKAPIPVTSGLGMRFNFPHKRKCSRFPYKEHWDYPQRWCFLSSKASWVPKFLGLYHGAVIDISSLVDQ